jgi:hypothetical protein
MILEIALGIWLGFMMVGLTIVSWVGSEQLWQEHKNRRWLRTVGTDD